MSLKITPGKWVRSYRRISNVIAENGAVIARVNNLLGQNQIKHDADFIAEAGTVANETGLMPRELLAHRDAAITLLALLLEQHDAQDEAHRDRGFDVEQSQAQMESRALIARVRGGK